MSISELSAVMQSAIQNKKFLKDSQITANRKEFETIILNKLPHTLYVNVNDLLELAHKVTRFIKDLNKEYYKNSNQYAKLQSEINSKQFVFSDEQVGINFMEYFHTTKESATIEEAGFGRLDKYKDKILDLVFSPNMEELKGIELQIPKKDGGTINTNMYSYVKGLIHKGHTFGSFNKKIDDLAKFIGSTKAANSTTAEEFFRNILNLLERLDIASSNANSKPYMVELKKQNKVTYNSLTVEFQFGEENSASGREVSKAAQTLSELFNKKYITVESKLEDLVTSLEVAAAKKGIEWHSMRGSASFKDDAIALFEEAMELDRPVKKARNSTTRVKQKVPDPRLIDRQKIKRAKEEVKKTLALTKNKAKIPPVTRETKGHFMSLLTLQELLNNRILEVLKKNMHSPQLNWRTGRFAESVKITGLTVSRQNSVNIFYTYMKNPYYVYEPGSGSRLASPRRDPKFLIDMSIREIATGLIKSKITTIRQ